MSHESLPKEGQQGQVVSDPQQDVNHRVVYLTWGETIVNNGIFDNQVFELLKEIRKEQPQIELMLLSGMPIINQRLLKHREQFYAEVMAIQKQLQSHQINFAYRWIPAVARWFHSQIPHFFLYTVGQQQFLRDLVVLRNIGTIHCRGYHATRLALLTKETFNLKCKVIFDTRGLFPEEGVYAGHFSVESPSFRKWKAIEKEMLDKADEIVNVSSTFTDYVRKLTKNPNVHTIYTTTNLEIFSRQIGHRKKFRQALNIEDNAKVLIYLGSIGIDEGWHRLSSLIDLYRAFTKAFDNTKLLIVTRSPHTPIRELLESQNDLKTDCLLISSNTPDETAQYLVAGDYGALPYRTLTNDIEELIGYTMIASKTGEYLAAGIPILVNRSVGAATQLVEEWAIGCSYTLGEENAIVDRLIDLEQSRQEVQKRCLGAAEEFFSTTKNAIRYGELYR